MLNTFARSGVSNLWAACGPSYIFRGPLHDLVISQCEDNIDIHIFTLSKRKGEHQQKKKYLTKIFAYLDLWR